jgi:hypothetical protein
MHALDATVALEFSDLIREAIDLNRGASGMAKAIDEVVLFEVVGALHPHFREASLDDLYNDYASIQILIGEDCSGRQVTVLDVELGDCLHEASQPYGVSSKSAGLGTSICKGSSPGRTASWADDSPE